MKKIIISFILILNSSFIFFTQASVENIFDDVQQNTKFHEAIQYAKENGIVNGYSDGTFRPENKINRAEFLKIILLSVYSQTEIQNYPIQGIVFEDALPETWFHHYTHFAFNHGIIKGYPDGTFKPYKNISLPEALKIIFKTKNIDTKEFIGENWYEEFIEKAKDLHLLNPEGEIENNLFHEITRGEMVWIIHQLALKNIESDNIEKVSENISWYKPAPNTSWQWQLAGKINTNYEVKMYDIDLEETPQKTIDLLHKQGKKVICYFNGGAYEPYRSDSKEFSKESLGKIMEGWEDEKWLDVANYEKFADIIKGRLDLAVLKNCDGVEPDNMDGFQNDSGFPLTYEDQLKYNKWIAEESHKRGLSIGLKNNLDQIEDLVDYFDFSVNEQCFEYNECELLTPFIKNNKAVFNVEYELELDEFCDQAKELKLSSLKMKYNLDGERLSCDEE